MMRTKFACFRFAFAFAAALAIFCGGLLPAVAQIKVACVGDSITAGYGLANPGTQSYPAQLQTILGGGYTVENYGASGATVLKQSDNSVWSSQWSSWAYTNSMNSSPNIVVIMFGANDSKSWNWNAANFNSDYRALITQYQNLATHPKVFVCYTPPMFLPTAFGTTFDPVFIENTVEPAIATISTQASVQLIDNDTPLINRPDLFQDGVHPTVTGAGIVAQRVADALLGLTPTNLTTAAITSSVNPSASGSPVTFTATISSSSGVVTGAVIFAANNVPFSTNTLSGGVASVNYSNTPVGNNIIAAQYVSQGSYLGSTHSLYQNVTAPPSTNGPTIYAFEGNAQDSSGNGNHGTATAVSYVIGKVGAQAAQFNGTSSYVSIPRSVQDDFTVAMWVKTTDTAGTAGAQWWNGKDLVDGEVGGGGADWGTAIVNGKFVLGVGSTGGDTTLASSVNINDGSWHHVAATRSNTSGAVAVYVDGVLRGSGTGATGSRTFPPSLRIGSLQTGNNFFNGTLDDVRLYDRILTASEIAALFAPPAPSTTTLQSSKNPSIQNSNVTFTATVSSGSGTPLGTVVFAANGVSFSTNTLVSGVAATSYNLISLGTNTISAQYAAQGNYLGSTGSLQQIVAPAIFTLAHKLVGGSMTLNWPAGGMLLEAPTLNGPWTTNTTGANSRVISPTNSMKFFRVLVP